MFSDVVYHHCSEFQIFRPLNGSYFLVLSLYPHSVQNQAWFCLHFSDHGKPKQTDVIFSRFVSLSLVNHGRLPRKNWPIAGFSPLFEIMLTGGKNNHKIKVAESGQLAGGSRHPPLRLQIYYFIISENADRLNGKGGDVWKVGPVVKWASRYYWYIHYGNHCACGFLLFWFSLFYTLKFLIYYFQFVNFRRLFQPSHSPLGGPEKLEYSV